MEFCSLSTVAAPLSMMEFCSLSTVAAPLSMMEFCSLSTVAAPLLNFVHRLSVGSLRNTEPLKYDERSHYTLEIEAEDCGGQVSETAVVEVDVVQKCVRGWHG